MFNQIYITEDVYLSDKALSEISMLSASPVLCQSAGSPRLDECDAIMASWGATLDARFLGQFGALRYVGLRCTSTDKVDVDYLRQRDVPLTNLGRYGDSGTCEFVIQQLLNGARPHASNTSRVTQSELRGKTLGVLGFGGVGRLVCEAALGLGMDVFVGTRNGRPEGLSGSLVGCRFGTVDKVVAGADIISVHTPAYTPVLSRDLLRSAKREVIVIATTLGLPFHMNDIAEFLGEENTRKVICDLCAAGDVPPGELPERFTVAQIYSARTFESVQRAERELIENLRRYTGALSNA